MNRKTENAAIQTGVCYMILSARSGKAITACTNNRIEMRDVSGNDGQLWSFEQVGDDVWRIVSKQTKDVVDVILSGSENGAQIHLWEDVGADNQKWIFEPVGDGLYKIVSKLSGRCLDVVGMSMEDGAGIQIWDYMGGDNQQWRIVDPTVPAAEKPVKKAAAPSAN